MSKQRPFQTVHYKGFLPGFAFTFHPVSLDTDTLPVGQALMPAVIPVAWAIFGVSDWHSVQKASPTPGMVLLCQDVCFLEGRLWSCALGLGSVHLTSPAIPCRLYIYPFELAFCSTEACISLAVRGLSAADAYTKGQHGSRCQLLFPGHGHRLGPFRHLD